MDSISNFKKSGLPPSLSELYYNIDSFSLKQNKKNRVSPKYTISNIMGILELSNTNIVFKELSVNDEPHILKHKLFSINEVLQHRIDRLDNILIGEKYIALFEGGDLYILFQEGGILHVPEQESCFMQAVGTLEERIYYIVGKKLIEYDTNSLEKTELFNFSTIPISSTITNTQAYILTVDKYNKKYILYKLCPNRLIYKHEEYDIVVDDIKSSPMILILPDGCLLSNTFSIEYFTQNKQNEIINIYCIPNSKDFNSMNYIFIPPNRILLLIGSSVGINYYYLEKRVPNGKWWVSGKGILDENNSSGNKFWLISNQEYETLICCLEEERV